MQNVAVWNTIPLWKRALDILCIVAAAPIWIPLGLLIAAVIKLVSSGPVFFRQERVGYFGRRFGCLKFRTMVVNADTSVHQGHLEELMKSNRPMTKLDKAGDARLIPCGLILRTLGLDELPQLLNVLRGEMSLVGPRPCLPYEYEKYLPRHHQRCATLPGLTGLWQISGKNRTTFEEMIDLDVHYAKHKSLWMDLRIILMTVPALLGQARDVSQRRRETVKTAIATRPLSAQRAVDQGY
jgi:lipopolysaccharide/colanic/teichoic acid biosynthesis glycosyltransferase